MSNSATSESKHLSNFKDRFFTSKHFTRGLYIPVANTYCPSFVTLIEVLMPGMSKSWISSIRRRISIKITS